MHIVPEATKGASSITELRYASNTDSASRKRHEQTEPSQELSHNQRGAAEPVTTVGALKVEKSKVNSTSGTDVPESSHLIVPLEAAPDQASTSAASYDQTTASVPLRELSPNSPPKPPFSRTKPQTSASLAQPDNDLSTAISSLLAHHKREPKEVPPSVPADLNRLGRRKKQLFGRAPSNLSTCSNGSINLSRASSVDTMNTDGLGTPLETVNSATMKADIKDPLTASLLASYDEHDVNDNSGENLQMTQLGYEDPEASAWRERLMNKMNGGGKETKGKGTTPKAKAIGTVQDAAGVGLQSVSRRTRHAGGR